VKILHLTTSQSGGAGVAAMRLAEAQGLDARMEVRVHTSRDESVSNPETRKREINAIKSKILTGFQQTITKNEIEFVSPKSVSRLDWKQIQDYGPDIIHIHNWYNFLNLEDINRLLSRYKVVFTAHDERLLTGGCHITFGCGRYEDGCMSCPQVRFIPQVISHSASKSHQILSDSKNYSLITPSHWLAKKFQIATFINPLAQVAVIPNMIPYEPKTELTIIPRTSFSFLFVTASANSSNKGLPEVLAAMYQLAQLNPELKFELRIAGVNKLNGLTSVRNLKVICLGFLNELEMEDQYRKSDALIVASKSENSPNVIPEAQISYAFVIAHSIGGIPEIIEDGVNGLLYESGKATLLSSLQTFVNLPVEKKGKILKSAREAAMLRHDPSRIIDLTFNLYSELLKRDSN
jgi:glycosyltransferase involved in cell wall biosynthesis